MLSLFFSLPMTIAMKSSFLNDIVRDGENIQLPSVEYVGWIDFLSRDAHKCSKKCLDSNKEGILSIALKKLSRVTQIALHWPCLESSSLIFHLMGCKHYFVADRLEDLVDEDDSRSSSRVHEHENFRLVSQLHVAIQTPWSRYLSPRAGGTSVHQRVAPFYLNLHLRLCLCLCLSLNVHNKQFGFLQSREKRVSISWALERDVCSVSPGHPVLWIGLGFAYVGWEPSSCQETSEPILLSKLDVNPSLMSTKKKPCSDVPSTLSACTVQGAVLSGRLSQDLWVLCP